MCVGKQQQPSLRYRLRLDRFDEHTARRGWTSDAQRAKGIGVSHTTIGRIRRGQMSPGLHFIGRVTAALGVDVAEVFEEIRPREV